jgi:hypothetical protein
MSLTGWGVICVECPRTAFPALSLVYTCTPWHCPPGQVCSAGASVKLGIYPELVEPGKPQHAFLIREMAFTNACIVR